MADRTCNNLLPSGISGLDTLLGGRLVEFSFNEGARSTRTARVSSPVFHSRLSAAEVTVLNAVSEAGETAVDPIMQETRLDAGNVRAARERLVRLGYLVAIERNGGVVYASTGGGRG